MRSFHLAAPSTTSVVRERVTVTHDTILIRERLSTLQHRGLWPTLAPTYYLHSTEQWSHLNSAVSVRMMVVGDEDKCLPRMVEGVRLCYRWMTLPPIRCQNFVIVQWGQENFIITLLTSGFVRFIWFTFYIFRITYWTFIVFMSLFLYWCRMSYYM